MAISLQEKNLVFRAAIGCWLCNDMVLILEIALDSQIQFWGTEALRSISVIRSIICNANPFDQLK